MRHVITLSTIPSRFDKIGPTLQSLLRQRSRPEAVELWIPQAYRRFPGWGGALPAVPEGVTIRRCAVDLGPASKVLPAVQERQGQAVEVIFGDDDHLYDPGWAAGFLRLRAVHPGSALCASGKSLRRLGLGAAPPCPAPQGVTAPPFVQQRAFQMRWKLARLMRLGVGRVPIQPLWRKMDRSGHVDVAEGFAGVAVQPSMFDAAAFDIPAGLWSVDDIWLSGHLARAGVPIWADRSLNAARAIYALSRFDALYDSVIEGMGRNQANQACVDHMRQVYGIWGGVQVNNT